MKRDWLIKLPAVVWIIIFVIVYIVIKSPPAGVFIISLPARVISGVGNFFIGLIHSYGGP
jgi:hypothetical protein